VFEIIGLLIDISVFLSMGGVCGIAFTLLAWLLLRRRTFFKIIPPFVAMLSYLAFLIWLGQPHRTSSAPAALF
jgi:hypothetical protein